MKNKKGRGLTVRERPPGGDPKNIPKDNNPFITDIDEEVKDEKIRKDDRPRIHPPVPEKSERKMKKLNKKPKKKISTSKKYGSKEGWKDLVCAYNNKHANIKKKIAAEFRELFSDKYNKWIQTQVELLAMNNFGVWTTMEEANDNVDQAIEETVKILMKAVNPEVNRIVDEVRVDIVNEMMTDLKVRSDGLGLGVEKSPVAPVGPTPEGVKPELEVKKPGPKLTPASKKAQTTGTPMTPGTPMTDATPENVEASPSREDEYITEMGRSPEVLGTVTKLVNKYKNNIPKLAEELSTSLDGGWFDGLFAELPQGHGFNNDPVNWVLLSEKLVKKFGKKAQKLGPEYNITLPEYAGIANIEDLFELAEVYHDGIDDPLYAVQSRGIRNFISLEELQALKIMLEEVDESIGGLAAKNWLPVINNLIESNPEEAELEETAYKDDDHSPVYESETVPYYNKDSKKKAQNLDPRDETNGHDDDVKFPGDYSVNVTYEGWTEKDIEFGDTDDKGFEVEDEAWESLDELLDNYEGFTAWEGWSSNHPQGNDWVYSQIESEFTSDSDKQYNLHISKADGTPLSQNEITFITEKLNLIN